MVIERVLSHLAHVYGGKRWLLGVEVAQAATPTCRRLRGWGCPPPFVVAGRSGSGPVPGADEALLTLLGRPPLPMMEAIHDAEEALRALPPEVQAAIDAWDPDRSAGALGAFFSDGRPIGGRPFFGARPAAWRRLEDKVAIDAVWDAAGVERAPSLLRPLEPGAVASAHATLDRGLGTVWSGDAERGFHGGATYTVHVPDGSAVDAAVAHLRTRCTTARGMPFLEGIRVRRTGSCSRTASSCCGRRRWWCSVAGARGSYTSAGAPAGTPRPRGGRSCGRWCGAWGCTCAPPSGTAARSRWTA
jgi:hypothetical protein